MRSPADVLVSGAPAYIKAIVNVSAATILAGLAVWLVVNTVQSQREGAAEFLKLLQSHITTTNSLESDVAAIKYELRQNSTESQRLQLATCLASAKLDQHARDVCIGLVPPPIK